MKITKSIGHDRMRIKAVEGTKSVAVSVTRSGTRISATGLTNAEFQASCDWLKLKAKETYGELFVRIESDFKF